MSTRPGPTMPQHAPYPPPVANLGGVPTKSVDDPITSVFLVLFILGAATHMTILQVNLRRGHKFVISGLLFGFCMARITTCTMRLVFTTYPHNVSIAIAAQIFVAAGVLLLFIINLIFTQRVIRASHPTWGWSKLFSIAFKVYYGSIVLLLIALIFCTVQAFYTLDTNIRRIDRDIQLLGGTYFAVAAFLPIPLLALNFLVTKVKPASHPTASHKVEKFGTGRFRTKICMLLFSSAILSFGAAFRAGISYVPRPRNNPAWYHSKACFYIVNFTIEIIVVGLYAVIRVDKRFHIPNGSKGPGDYLGQKEGGQERETGFLGRINSEEEAFGGEEREERKDLEMGKVDEVANEPRPDTATLEKPAAVLGAGEDKRFSRVPTLKTSGEFERKLSGEMSTPVRQTLQEDQALETSEHGVKRISSETKTPVEKTEQAPETQPTPTEESKP